MSAKNDWLNWCLGMNQSDEEEFHNNDELHETYVPELMSHPPYIVIKDGILNGLQQQLECTEDIGDDN